MIKVIKAKANDDLSLDLKFGDGSEKRFDVSLILIMKSFEGRKIGAALSL